MRGELQKRITLYEQDLNQAMWVAASWLGLSILLGGDLQCRGLSVLCFNPQQ